MPLIIFTNVFGQSHVDQLHGLFEKLYVYSSRFPLLEVDQCMGENEKFRAFGSFGLETNFSIDPNI